MAQIGKSNLFQLQLRAFVGLLGASQQRIRRARIADQVEMIGTLLEAIDHHLVAAADLVDTLRYGLQFTTSGKPHRLASDLTTHLAAEMLVQHLQQSGFVLMKKPPAGTAAALWRPSPHAEPEG